LRKLSAPDWGLYYARRVIATALCQGAALHYLHPRARIGINDFDVYTFYAAHPRKRWYAKRIQSVDFGDPTFGQSVDHPEFVGRRVDLMGRGIDIGAREDPADARRLLSAPASCRAIAQALVFPSDRQRLPDVLEECVQAAVCSVTGDIAHAKLAGLIA